MVCFFFKFKILTCSPLYLTNNDAVCAFTVMPRSFSTANASRLGPTFRN